MNKLIAIVFLLLSLPLAAQEASESGESAGDEEDRPLTTPSERAAESDYVVLAQIDVFDYEERRGVPVSGDTWVDVLVRYKVPRPSDRYKIVEKGHGEQKCYFPEADLWNELPRYLLFLVDKSDGEGREVSGHPDGCAVPVVTTTDNKYVVRWPIKHMRFESDVESLVQEFEFHGPGTVIDLENMLGFEREEAIERMHLEPVEDRRFRYRYTRGIPLRDFRELLGSENLTRDRIQRGR